VIIRVTADHCDAEKKVRGNEGVAPNQLYTYIRELGYCPHCELRGRAQARGKSA